MTSHLNQMERKLSIGKIVMVEARLWSVITCWCQGQESVKWNLHAFLQFQGLVLKFEVKCNATVVP